MLFFGEDTRQHPRQSLFSPHIDTAALCSTPRLMPRPSTTQRGYGAHHQALRERLRPEVEAGVVRCARCGQLIAPGERWDLGHDDYDRISYAGPEHARCNRATNRIHARRVSRIW